ncbi:isocitrate lyase/PEP mutase family protein [Cupriavidus basilensis]|uniref:isocitrate lyase/PEP mutase family protein n=1 Tax=Cupriavidus basilensis TaxID=68895 RepID=UPI001ED94381|nr:isocitrate lyase/PEP mutase family protein [Cupriavidus basilensis]
MTLAATLRQHLQAPGMIIAPGAYDAIGARLVEQAGFPACYMTGAGTSAARGFPDFGLLTMSEMVENAAVMARSVSIPLIADADTGYGNELNVTRTVREYEARGVAAIHIEDQVAPKRCGHLDGKEVVSREAFVSKIRAALEAMPRSKPARIWLSWKPRRPSRKSRPCQGWCAAPACLTWCPAAARRSSTCARPRPWATSWPFCRA